MAPHIARYCQVIGQGGRYRVIARPRVRKLKYKNFTWGNLLRVDSRRQSVQSASAPSDDSHVIECLSARSHACESPMGAKAFCPQSQSSLDFGATQTQCSSNSCKTLAFRRAAACPTIVSLTRNILLLEKACWRIRKYRFQAAHSEECSAFKQRANAGYQAQLTTVKGSCYKRVRVPSHVLVRSL